MHIFKTHFFAKWARKERLSDELLKRAVFEIDQGLIDADLGGHVYKKRIALNGHGKRGGVRSIIAYKAANKAFFIFGYAKNKKASITQGEKKVVKVFTSELFSYSSEQLNTLVKTGKLIKVKYNE